MNALKNRNLVALMVLGVTSGAVGCTAEISGRAQQSGGAAATGGPLDPTAGTASGGNAFGGSGGGTVDAACQNDPALRLPPLLRSLSGQQYRRVLQSAFPSADQAVKAMPNPWEISELSTPYTTDGSSLKMNQEALGILLDGTQAIAAAARAKLAADHPCLGTLSPDSARSSCLAEVVDALLGKLFNGDIVPSERSAKIDFLSKLIDDFGVNQALETFSSTVMMSPRTIFRTELGSAAAAAGQLALTARELAEALSFSIAGNRPDAALLSAIQDGALSADEIRQHAQRLAHAVEDGGADAFVAETLTVSQLADTTRTVDGDTNALPEDMRAALELEARETIKRLVRSDGSLVTNLLTSDVALARKETLALHGVSAANLTPDAGGFYALTTPGRPGLLLQPSMMALLAAENHSDAVKRGHFMMSQFMCVPVPPPPPDVPPLPTVDPTKPLTVRQRLETVHKLPACQACHKFMDGIGLSFEAYDQLGRERTMELGLPVDTSGDVSVGIPSLDGKLANAQELMKRLSQASEVRTCVGAQAFTYLSGIPASTDHGGCLWQTMASLLDGTDGNMVDEFARLLASDLYRTRYPEAADSSTSP